MVEGTVYLSDGQKVKLYAGDMLTALKVATGTYYGIAKRMHFRTVEGGSTDGGCGVGEDHDGHVRQSEDQALAAASGR